MKSKELIRIRNAYGLSILHSKTNYYKCIQIFEKICTDIKELPLTEIGTNTAIVYRRNLALTYYRSENFEKAISLYKEVYTSLQYQDKNDYIFDIMLRTLR